MQTPTKLLMLRSFGSEVTGKKLLFRCSANTVGDRPGVKDAD